VRVRDLIRSAAAVVGVFKMTLVLSTPSVNIGSVADESKVAETALAKTPAPEELNS
jgi:hypothetical protein